MHAVPHHAATFNYLAGRCLSPQTPDACCGVVLLYGAGPTPAGRQLTRVGSAASGRGTGSRWLEPDVCGAPAIHEAGLTVLWKKGIRRHNNAAYNASRGDVFLSGR